MISPAPTPKPVRPRMRSPSFSTRAFRKPWVSQSARARSTPSIGILNKRYAMPRSLASFSLRPTRANSGAVNRQNGTCLRVVTCLEQYRVRIAPNCDGVLWIGFTVATLSLWVRRHGFSFRRRGLALGAGELSRSQLFPFDGARAFGCSDPAARIGAEGGTTKLSRTYPGLWMPE